MMGRVLIMNNAPATVELLQKFLVTRRCEVLTVSNGTEALQKVKEERPHLLLLEITTSETDGLDVLRQVKAVDPTVGVIIAPGVNEEAIGQQAMELGAFDYLVKPLDLAYLERCLWYQLAMSSHPRLKSIV